jgi:hypothetical protein
LVAGMACLLASSLKLTSKALTGSCTKHYPKTSVMHVVIHLPGLLWWVCHSLSREAGTE